MAPILKLKPAFTNLTSVPWQFLNTATSFGLDSIICTPQQIRSVYSANLKNLNAPTSISSFKKLADFYAKYPEGRGVSISLESFPPGKVREIADSSSAYPWRETVTYL